MNQKSIVSSFITYYFALICLSDEKGVQSCSTSENINQTLKLDVTHTVNGFNYYTFRFSSISFSVTLSAYTSLTVIVYVYFVIF